MRRADAEAELETVNAKMRVIQAYVRGPRDVQPPMSLDELSATMKRWDELLWLLSVGQPDD